MKKISSSAAAEIRIEVIKFGSGSKNSEKKILTGSDCDWKNGRTDDDDARPIKDYLKSGPWSWSSPWSKVW